jgi:hypothetical protein
MGTANGYVEIMLITWLQKRTRPQMQGCMMSLTMFVTMGLTPVSTPIAGALVKLNPTLFLLFTGVLAAALSLVAVLNFLRRERDMVELSTHQVEDGSVIKDSNEKEKQSSSSRWVCQSLSSLRGINSCPKLQTIFDNRVLAALDQSGLPAFLPHSIRL